MKFLKNVISVIVFLVFLGAVGYYLWVSGPPCPPDGMVIVEQTDIDSIDALVEQYKDSIQIDTIWMKQDTIYITHTVPETKPTVDPQVNISRDSLITPWYSVYVVEKLLNNAVIGREWKHTPPKWQIVEKTVLKPVISTIPYAVQESAKKKLIASAGIGAGTMGIPGKLRLNYISEKGVSYGGSYLRAKDTWLISFDIGITLVSW